MSIDVSLVRRSTPGVGSQAYLENAGSSLMPAQVVNAMVDYLQLEAAIGGYAAAREREEELSGLYRLLSRLIGCDPDEIAVTGSATAAWQMAFYSFKFEPGDRILTCSAEYAANYVAYLQARRRYGVVIDVVPNDRFGEVDCEALADMVDDRVRLISMTWIPTNGGLVNPAARVGDLARKHGIPYLLDACQAVGQLPVDVDVLGCTMLAATGRKFLRGPRGTGFLYVRREFLNHCEPAMIDHFGAPWVQKDRYELRPDARRFETWENNYVGRMGLAAAVDMALNVGIEAIAARCTELSTRLRQGIEAIDGVVGRDLGRHSCAIVSFEVEGVSAEAVVQQAARAGVVVGSSAPGSTRIDAEARRLSSLVRASPHYFNTRDEIDRLLEQLIPIRDSTAGS